MRGFAAVFRREIAERRLIAVVVLLGLVPLALPWIGGSSMGSPDARSAVAIALALIASLVLAVLLGASVMAPELAERRLGFYFSRPIGANAVWAGKLAAAFALALAGALAIAAPTWLVERRITLGFLGAAGASLLEGVQIAKWLLVLLLVVLASHAVSVMVRARSPWLLADVAGAAAVALLAWDAMGQLLLYQAITPLERLLAGLATALLVALLVATALQVSRGRTDLRRSHRVLSLCLWTLLLVAALGGGGFSRWVLAAGPEDLDQVKGLVTAPSGAWVAVTGTAPGRGFEPGLLVNVASGRFLRLGPGGFSMATRPWFSADGHRVGWLEWRSGNGPAELVYADLGAGEGNTPRPVATGLSFPASASLALSPDGRLVAAATMDRLLVHDLGSGRLVASAALGDQRTVPDGICFVGPGRVRLYRTQYQPAESPGGGSRWITAILEHDLATGQLAETGRFESDPGAQEVLGPGGDRLVLYAVQWGGHHSAGVYHLLDGRTGAFLADLSILGGKRMEGRPRFLADGRIAVATGLAAAGEPEARKGMALRLLDRDGAPLADFPFPGARVLEIAGQPGPERLAVATSNDEAGGPGWEVWILDLATGASRPLARGLAPAPWLLGMHGTTRGPLLFVDRDHELVWLDPETGRQRPALRRADLDPVAGRTAEGAA